MTMGFGSDSQPAFLAECSGTAGTTAVVDSSGKTVASLKASRHSQQW